jgi:hypothetical protein
LLVGVVSFSDLTSFDRAEESCQESSALGFVTRLGVPDIIGSETVSLAELSAKTAAEEQFLGTYADRIV